MLVIIRSFFMIVIIVIGIVKEEWNVVESWKVIVWVIV